MHLLGSLLYLLLFVDKANAIPHDAIKWANRLVESRTELHDPLVGVRSRNEKND